ncbi:MAG TPA: FAD-binding protein, partial [Candidatus Angelobacter sp.]|nr:FAD-binding protein [Candidatus Angelobacter sp.]
MNIQENIPLAPLTTFRVGGPARYFIDAHSEHDVSEAVAFAFAHKLPLFVLGGGSNLLVSDEGWPGLVLKVSLVGVEYEGDSQKMLFHSGAGENWDSLVALAVSKNCGGVECLSGIPGNVGGTPVQNVGAYGQEVSETITHLRAVKVATGELIHMSNRDCGFSYRSSIFNTTHRSEYVVLAVSYRLQRNREPKIEYADLKKFFTANPDRPTLQQVRDAVRSIRQSKAMLL